MHAQLNPPGPWSVLRRLVLPQHTDHAGVHVHWRLSGLVEEARCGEPCLGRAGLPARSRAGAGAWPVGGPWRWINRQPLKAIGDAVEVRQRWWNRAGGYVLIWKQAASPMGGVELARRLAVTWLVLGSWP